MNIATILKSLSLITATLDAVRGISSRFSAWRESRRQAKIFSDRAADARIIAAEVAELDRILNEKTGE